MRLPETVQSARDIAMSILDKTSALMKPTCTKGKKSLDNYLMAKEKNNTALLKG